MDVEFLFYMIERHREHLHQYSVDVYASGGVAILPDRSNARVKILVEFNGDADVMVITQIAIHGLEPELQILVDLLRSINAKELNSRT